MISVRQAEILLSENLPSPLTAVLPLASARGCRLATDIFADRDYPPFDRITHDGVAIAYAAYAQGRRHFAITGYAAAGYRPLTLTDCDACIEVATGAPLPEGCDTVVPYEWLEKKNGGFTLHEKAALKLHDCLHIKGSDKKAGHLLLPGGQAIGIQEMAMLAANGVAQVPVFAKPAIGILSTGDELVAPGAAVESYQIRRSNDLALKAALAANGFTEVETGWAPDDKPAIARILAQWLAEGKWIVITGGVSRGTYDYVPDVLADLKVRTLFHHVAQRPGKPLWVGMPESGAPVFGLPGNPNSSLVCLTRYVLPALRQASGAKPGAVTRLLDQALVPHPALTLFTPVAAVQDLNRVRGIKTQGSGDFIALQGTVGFVELPPADIAYAKGEKMPFYPWSDGS